MRNTCHGPRTSLPQRTFHPTDHVQQDICPPDNLQGRERHDIETDDDEGGSELDSIECVVMMVMMSFIYSCRNKIGAELHIYLEEGTYHKRLFRGPSTNDMKK